MISIVTSNDGGPMLSLPYRRARGVVITGRATALTGRKNIERGWVDHATHSVCDIALCIHVFALHVLLVAVLRSVCCLSEGVTSKVRGC